MNFYNNDLDDASISEILREKEEEQEQEIQELYDKGIISDYRHIKNGNGKSNSNHVSLQDLFIDKSLDENLIKSETQSKDFVEYIIKQIKKTVKCEDILIRQILYTGLSSYIGFDPINLGIIAPTSEGKTYPVEECIKLFPKQDVEKVGSMSAKVLVRKRGILVDKNLNPIEDKLKELYRQKNSTKDANLKIELNEEIDKLYEGAKTLIDLRGKILVFLEPPQQQVWEILKPILSHDSEEIEYPFVNKTDKEGHETKEVVVRGWPSCIFCSAKDESSWSIWPEIKSRCLITSPNMIPQKYKQSTKLIAAKYGKPNSIQQRIIISDNDIKLAKDCILLLKQKINELRLENDNGRISYWIPYAELLEAELPSNKGPDVRFQKRVFAFLRTIPILKYNLRKLLVLEGNETSVIADLRDLRETLSIVQNFDGIPRQKVEFFNDVFYPFFKSKTKPDENRDGSKKEDIIAVTAKELCDFYKEKKNKIINTDNLKKTFLNELENNGIIDHEISQIHGKQYIYYPLVEPFDNNNFNTEDNNNESLSFSSNLSQFDQISQYSSKIYEKIITNLSEKQLFYEIEGVFPHRIDMTKFTTDLDFEKYLDSHEEELKILDANDNNSRITTRQFIQDYLSYDPEICKTQFDEKISPSMPSFNKRSDSSSNLSNFDEKDEKFIPCHYCDYTYRSEEEVEKHSIISHPGKPARPDPGLLELTKKKKEKEGELMSE